MTSFTEGIILLCIGIFGLAGNVLSIPYFIRRRPGQKTFYTLFIYLSVCDIIVVVIGMLLYGLPKVSEKYAEETFLIIAPYILPTFEIGSTGGIYFTMAICIERYLVVCRPFWYREKNIPSTIYTIPIICFSVLYNIPRFFELKTVIDYGPVYNDTNIYLSAKNKTLEITADFDGKMENVSIYSIEATAMRLNVAYYGIYHIGCAIIFQFMLPLLVLLVGNVMILQRLLKDSLGSSPICSDGARGQFGPQVTQHRRRSQIGRTRVTLAICGIFTACHLFKWVLNIYELYVRYNLSEKETEQLLNDSVWFETVVSISNTLVVLNSSINFYVYLLKICWMT